LQSGKIVLLSGLPSLVMMALVPVLLRFDVRIAVGLGLGIMAFASLYDSDLTIAADGGDFVASQLLRGVGRFGHAVPQPGLRAIGAGGGCGRCLGPVQRGAQSGGSIALAGIATIQDQREWFHSRRLEERSCQFHAGAGQGARAGRLVRAAPQLEQQIGAQALVMTYNDIFWIMGCARSRAAAGPVPSPVSQGCRARGDALS
jgi:DHA2 family multidrug resistance protein